MSAVFGCAGNKTIKQIYYCHSILFTYILDNSPSMSLMSILGVGRNTAYELVRAGQIRSIRIGHKICIPKTEVIRFLTCENK